MKNIFMFLVAVLLSCHLIAQNTVTGVVIDGTDNSPMIGASVMVKGTTVGAVTGINGDFTLKVPAGKSILVISSVGYKTQEVSVAGKKTVKVTLQADNKVLDEVVVVGYGVQKKKLVTGATVQVKGDNLAKLNTTGALDAMQSQSPGVNIVQSSGQPGDGYKVNIRGLGTMGSYAPLYVIDGAAGGDINALNPADIESIDVLKDAASCAIYGARGANGVILVTTKQGKAGKISVSYDGYVGWQNVYRMPKMLNAKQYMDVQDLIAYNEGNDKVNNWAEYIEPSRLAAYQNGTDEGTDWLEEIRTKNAPITDHALNITGGNEMSKFSLGVSYLNQKGIFGHPVESKFERTTVRMNSDHTIYKANNRDIVTFGETILYTYKTNGGIGQGNTYWNDLFNCMQAFPIVPVRNANGEYYTYNDMAYDGDQTTYPYSQGYKGMLDYDLSTPNPVADMVYNRGHNISKSHALNMTAYLKISPIQGLTFKSQFGYRLSAYNYRSYTPYYKINTTSQNLSETVSQSSGMGWSYTVDNTLDYDFKIDKNDIDVMAGQSFEKWGFGEDMSASDGSLLFTGMDYAWLSNSQTKSKGSVSGGPWSKGAIASFFGRVNWNYDETYMATAILRTDGSSNFMRGHRWGWFPSFSAGWVVSNEAFMESTKSWLDFLKLRASWGLNGNCNISPFQYLATVSFGNIAGYRFGSQTLGNYTQGAYADILPNEDVTWEKSEQLDLGFDARFLNSRLNVAFDWYKKTTKDWLLVKDILLTAGTGAPYYNGGNVENKGFELGLNWNDKIGREFNYGASVNIAYNKNKVTKINTATGVIYGASNTLFQGSSTAYAAKVGEPIGYFWGYKTAGVFQNREEIEAWKSAGKPFIDSYKNIQPGDLKFVDSNGDGKLDDSDKTKIGDPNPHWTLGTSLNCSYKGFDLAVTTYGNFGVDVIRSYRRTVDSRRNNFTTEVFGYWHGEGTSNTYPRLQDGSKGTNWQTVSDIYVDNADFLKIKNVTIGYDFKKLWKSSPLQQIRCYFTVENLYTFTGYKGFDPEVGSSAGTGSDWARGIDIGCYPQPRTVMFGVNLKF